MCSVLLLNPGEMIDEEYLFNAVHNNEHGYGILLKDKKKIQVIKALPEKVDPDAIYKILKDNDDIERWVHLRNMSQGELNINNVQPIQVYHSRKRDVFFMHNGTIYNVFVPDAQKGLIPEELDDKRDSDSRRYALAKIAPLLLRMKGANGEADITDPFLQDILGRAWTSQNGRAVLVSSDQDPLLFNPSSWEKIKNADGTEFLASNDDYFKKLKRGTLFEAREEEERKKRQSLINRPTHTPSNRNSEVHLLDCLPFQKEHNLSENIVNILEEYDLFSPDGFIAMSYIDKEELYKLFKDNLEDAIIMFMYLTSYLRDATEANEKLLKKQAETKMEDAHVG